MPQGSKKFPFDVAYGTTRVFRVRCINIGTYHVEQRVSSAPEKWNCLAISHHSAADEAIGVMLGDQLEYLQELSLRRRLLAQGGMA